MRTISVLKIQEVPGAFFNLIDKELANDKKVLWLISGGSSLPVALEVVKRLRKSKNIFVTLVDDVYLTGGNSQSNWNKFKQLGFNPELVACQGILQEELSLSKTTEAFEDLLQKRLLWADVTIGQFGLGEGFHTGGIQPNSPAANEDDKLAVGYQDGSTQRITVTPALIRKLDVAFINSMGESKRELVQHFLKSQAKVMSEPTQVLKQAKKTVLCSDVL